MYQVLTQLCWNCCAMYDIGPCRPKFSCIIFLCCDYIYDVSWLFLILIVFIHVVVVFILVVVVYFMVVDVHVVVIHVVVIHVVVVHVVVVIVLDVDIYIYTCCGCVYLNNNYSNKILIVVFHCD